MTGFPRHHLVIHGTVQGVGFRMWTRDLAVRAGLAGYIRNRTDGTVELEVAGDPAALARFRDAVRRGPPGARVGRIEEVPPGDAGLPRPFAIVY